MESTAFYDNDQANRTAPEPTAAEACKAQLTRLTADEGLHPRIRAAAIARRFREELTDDELTSLINDLSDELQRHRSEPGDRNLKHHGRRLAVLEAAIDVLRVRTTAGG
jgi:hypothetical protein